MAELTGQIRYQLLLLMRTPRGLFAGLLFPLVLLVLRSGGHPRPAVEAGLVAGLTILGVISTAYLTHATGLVSARQDGVLRRWRATPLPRWCFFAGRSAATVLLAVAGAAVTVLSGALFYGVRPPASGVATLLLAVVLGALAWAAIGTAVSAFIPSAQSAQPLLALTFYPVTLLSGVFGPVGNQPGWLESVVRYLPVRPIVDAATSALRHGGAFSGSDLAVLAGWALAGILASLVFFRWDPRRTG